MSSKSKSLLFQSVIEDFVKFREWEDEVNTDLEAQTCALVTGVSLGEYTGGKLIIEASDKSQIVGVFFYLPFECKVAKRSEMFHLLNEINTRGGIGGYGCFQLLEEGDDRIRWVHRVDFEGSSPTGKSIEQMVGPGWERVNAFIEVIHAVALTKQSAVEALDQFDSSES